VKNINYDEIERKYKNLIDISKNYMSSINDFEHDINHMNDVVFYTKELLNKLNVDINYDVCIISAYWHDVGRIKVNNGHEKLSSEMLKKIMEKNNYDKKLIEECCKAIENHKWNMKPETVEGLVIKDADKLAWLGRGRWNSCFNNNQKLDELIELLPRLKNEFLYFEESKLIYDKEVVNLIKYLYEKCYIKK
jgi:HD superfamily phosphodiesterase